MGGGFSLSCSWATARASSAPNRTCARLGRVAQPIVGVLGERIAGGDDMWLRLCGRAGADAVDRAQAVVRQVTQIAQAVHRLRVRVAGWAPGRDANAFVVCTDVRLQVERLWRTWSRWRACSPNMTHVLSEGDRGGGALGAVAVARSSTVRAVGAMPALMESFCCAPGLYRAGCGSLRAARRGWSA